MLLGKWAALLAVAVAMEATAAFPSSRKCLLCRLFPRGAREGQEPDILGPLQVAVPKTHSLAPPPPLKIPGVCPSDLNGKASITYPRSGGKFLKEKKNPPSRGKKGQKS